MENLQKIRKEKGIKQTEVAKYLNISRGSYSRYETGIRKVDPDTLLKLSEFFDVSTDYLLGNTNIAMTLSEIRFDKEVDNMSDEELLKRYDFNYEGLNITEEEAKKMLELIRTLKK